MSALSRLRINDLAGLYAGFFNVIWSLAFTKKIVTIKQCPHSQMTPPWLRSDVIFIHGPSRNVSIPFSSRMLPNKNKIRQAGCKILGCAILDTWMTKETISANLMLSMLAERRVSLPDDFAFLPEGLLGSSHGRQN